MVITSTTQNTSATTTVGINAFNQNLHGCKILVQGVFNENQYAPIMESVERLKSPFRKKVLLTNTIFSFNKYMPLQYDTTFQVKDLQQDWQLIITYITYAPKPLLIVAEDIEIPEVIWKRINNTITFIHIVSSFIRNVQVYDAIFFAPIEDQTLQYTEYVYKILQNIRVLFYKHWLILN